MEDFSVNNTSLDNIYDYGDNFHYEHYKDVGFNTKKAQFIVKVVTWVIGSVGLLSHTVTIYATCSLVRRDNVACVYFINLLLTGLIQLCSMVVFEIVFQDKRIAAIFFNIYIFGLMASVGFMLCIALERYLVITSPQFSCLRQVIQIPIVVCFVIWAPPLFCAFRVTFFVEFVSTEIIISFVCFILLPFPLLMYLLGGALKALSAAGSVPPDEKRRTVAILVLVLLIYTLLFLPTIIWSLVRGIGLNTVSFVLITIIRLIPLTNMSVYFFLRKGAADKLLACVCCCSMDHGEISSRVNNDTVITVSSV
ncbi:G-protein coupled receptor 4-like isoform X1 [Channa argus]|uniref:G-protein coupled receptor 4-like isoform X1 n=1 Tax=Channa argus TaxID=215402 RepID=UPI0035215957